MSAPGPASKPRIHIAIEGYEPAIIGPWSVMHHRGRRDAIADLQDIEKLLRKRGYIERAHAEDPLRRGNSKD